MKTRTGSYYERLGVAPEATQEEIKRAYFRAVRRYPPERDPEGFQALREAYETLGDPRSRKQYDSLLKHGGEIERLFGEAQGQMEREDFQGAARSLKRILVLAPESEAARVQLAFSHLHLEEHEEALRQFDRLCQGPDPNPQHLYWAAQARCFLARKEGLPAARTVQLQDQAMKLFARASQLDPLNAEPHLGMARLHHLRGETEKALACIEKAVAADGRVDFQDFDALLLACYIHLSGGDFPGFDRTVLRIDALSPDPEMRHYAGWQFARSAVSAAGAGDFVAAGKMAGAALQFAPGEPSLAGLAGHFRELAEVSREFDSIPDNEAFLKHLLALELRIGMGDESEAAELEKAWGEAMDFLPKVHPEHLLKWGTTLKDRCPAFYARNRDLVDHMLERGKALAPVLVQGLAASRDPALRPFLQALAAVAHDAILDSKRERREEFRQATVVQLELASRAPVSTVRAGVEHLKSRYPALHKHMAGVLEEVLRVAGTVPAVSNSSASSSSDDSSGCCGCLGILAILGILSAFAGGG